MTRCGRVSPAHGLGPVAATAAQPPRGPAPHSFAGDMRGGVPCHSPTPNSRLRRTRSDARMCLSVASSAASGSRRSMASTIATCSAKADFVRPGGQEIRAAEKDKRTVEHLYDLEQIAVVRHLEDSVVKMLVVADELRRVVEAALLIVQHIAQGVNFHVGRVPGRKAGRLALQHLPHDIEFPRLSGLQIRDDGAVAGLDDQQFVPLQPVQRLLHGSPADAEFPCQLDRVEAVPRLEATVAKPLAEGFIDVVAKGSGRAGPDTERGIALCSYVSHDLSSQGRLVTFGPVCVTSTIAGFSRRWAERRPRTISVVRDRLGAHAPSKADVGIRRS